MTAGLRPTLTIPQQGQLDRGLWVVDGRSYTFYKCRRNEDGTLYFPELKRRMTLDQLGTVLFFGQADARSAALAYYHAHQDYFHLPGHESDTHAPAGDR